LQFPADIMIKSSSNLPAVQKYYGSPTQQLPLTAPIQPPFPAQTEYYIKSDYVDRKYGKSGLPVPPESLWAGYGKTEEAFLNSGKHDIETIMELVNPDDSFIHKANRILDFGCASGRMIRWLADLGEGYEIWGVDVSALHIAWCQENLSPPFNFATVTTAPHLPFEDKYFDLIYCGSVFTHIDDLADAWLLELKRIMRIGGRLYVTVHDKHTVDLVINHLDRVPYAENFRRLLMTFDKHIDFQRSNYYMFTMFPGKPESQVFYDIDYLRQHWGRILNIISVTPEAYGYQTALVMEK
jgi:ubiquinone/menaquinone biosynthesis C-methylase UbiE